MNSPTMTGRPPQGVPQSLVLLLATGAGLGAATLYLSQPLLGLMAQDLQVSNRAAGWIPTLTQLGYALGILLLAPLGDRFERRTLIALKTIALTLALISSAMAANVQILWGTALIGGLMATLAQDIVPAAAAMAPDTQRGKLVGQVMTGLLLGILLSRVFSGFVGQLWGWRAVFWMAAALVALIGLVCARGLPRMASVTSLGYGALLHSMLLLWNKHRELRVTVWAQGLLSVAFSAFWSTLAVMLQQRHGTGSAGAGLFGLAGALGALAAPWAGKWADRYGSRIVVRWGAGVTTVAFACMLAGELLPRGGQFALLIAVACAFDFGVQVSLVGHQSRVYQLDAAARSRLNALLLTGMFIGMSAGSALGNLALSSGGWGAVALLCTLAAAAAWLLRLRA
jgi:predicted MFS family arabinose efflux permease